MAPKTKTPLALSRNGTVTSDPSDSGSPNDVNPASVARSLSHLDEESLLRHLRRVYDPAAMELLRGLRKSNASTNALDENLADDKEP